MISKDEFLSRFTFATESSIESEQSTRRALYTGALNGVITKCKFEKIPFTEAKEKVYSMYEKLSEIFPNFHDESILNEAIKDLNKLYNKYPDDGSYILEGITAALESVKTIDKSIVDRFITQYHVKR